MKKAVKASFPSAGLLSCTNHLKKNAIKHIKDKIGLRSKARKVIMESIFEHRRVTNATDEVTFDFRSEEAKKIIRTTSLPFLDYYTNNLLPHLQQNLTTHLDSSSDINLTNWTNNNCESLNAVLKRQVDWRPQDLLDLIFAIYKIVQAQYKEVERSLCGLGEYSLCDSHKEYAMSIDEWCKMDGSRKEAHLKRFSRERVLKGKRRLNPSSDGVRIVIKPAHGGIKPGQFKRKKEKSSKPCKKQRN